MNVSGTSKPPVDAEQWLDLIIASAAHRSKNEALRKFGELLLQRYFVSVPARYSDDKTASAYLDEVLCVVASGIRGFSIVRDMFETDWEALRNAKQRELDRAEHIDAYSPLKKGGHWQRAVGIVGSLGLATSLGLAARVWISKSSVLAIAVVAFSLLVALMGIEAVVDWIRGRRLRNCEMRFPAELLDHWEERTLGGYRKVARQIFPLLVEVRNKYYPQAQTDLLTFSAAKPGANPQDTAQAYVSGEALDALIERHFAFKPRKEGK